MKRSMKRHIVSKKRNKEPIKPRASAKAPAEVDPPVVEEGELPPLADDVMAQNAVVEDKPVVASEQEETSGLTPEQREILSDEEVVALRKELEEAYKGEISDEVFILACQQNAFLVAEENRGRKRGRHVFTVRMELKLPSLSVEELRRGAKPKEGEERGGLGWEIVEIAGQKDAKQINVGDRYGEELQGLPMLIKNGLKTMERVVEGGSGEKLHQALQAHEAMLAEQGKRAPRKKYKPKKKKPARAAAPRAERKAELVDATRVQGLLNGGAMEAGRGAILWKKREVPAPVLREVSEPELERKPKESDKDWEKREAKAQTEYEQAVAAANAEYKQAMVAHRSAHKWEVADCEGVPRVEKGAVYLATLRNAPRNIQEAAKKGHFATSGDVFTDIYSAIPYDDEEPQTNEQESEAEADKSEEKQTATGA